MPNIEYPMQKEIKYNIFNSMRRRKKDSTKKKKSDILLQLQMRAGFEGDGDGVAGADSPEKVENGPRMVSMSPLAHS